MSDQNDLTTLCDRCGAPITDGSELYSVVADSSVVHLADPSLDGWRLIVACGPLHLQQLQEEYDKRPFVEAQQWAGKVLRAQGDALTDEELRVLTGLTDQQIHEGREYAQRNGMQWRTPP